MLPPLWALMLLLASFLPMATGHFFSRQHAIAESGRIRQATQAENFMVYRAAVMRYAELNPSVLGTIAPSSLPLPVGFVAAGAWTNSLTNTTIYVYSSTGSEGPILSAQDEAQWLHGWIAGYNQGGTWMTSSGAAGALPNYIPNAAVVAVIQR